MSPSRAAFSAARSCSSSARETSAGAPSAFAVLFICFFKDYATAVFLFAPGSEVIGTTLLSFWIQGDAGPVAALAMLQVLLTFAFVYGVRLLFGVRVYG